MYLSRMIGVQFSSSANQAIRVVGESRGRPSLQSSYIQVQVQNSRENPTFLDRVRVLQKYRQRKLLQDVPLVMLVHVSEREAL